MFPCFCNRKNRTKLISSGVEPAFHRKGPEAVLTNVAYNQFLKIQKEGWLEMGRTNFSIASRMEAIAIRLEAIAIRLEAIAII